MSSRFVLNWFDQVLKTQDVCIFCAFKRSSDLLIPVATHRRQTRQYRSTVFLKRPGENGSVKAERNGGGPAPGGVWGSFGGKLGSEDYDQPEAWELPQKKLQQETTNNAESQDSRWTVRRNLRDIIPPRQVMPSPERSGYREQRQKETWHSNRQNRPAEGSAASIRFLGVEEPRKTNRQRDQIWRPTSATSRFSERPSGDPQQLNDSQSWRERTHFPASSARVSSQGGQGRGMDDLMRHTAQSDRMTKQDAKKREVKGDKNSTARSNVTQDFAQPSEKSMDSEQYIPARHTPGHDTQFTRPSTRTEESERVQRRRQRFEVFEEDDSPEPVAQRTERPSRARRREKGADRYTKNTRYDEEFEESLEFDDRKKKRKKEKKEEEGMEALPQIPIPDFIGIEQLAKLLKVRIEEFIRHLEDMGFESPNHDHILDSETAALIAQEYNFLPMMAASTTSDLVARPPPEDRSVLPPRPPIITIMGHVDHGKTTILDYLRKSSVAASEHGGITQHIGAFSVQMPGGDRVMTFLDTPGHAAFLEMRRRGANVTDIVVLVVAADDGVRPQTLEAIKHALDANVQIIVAISKIDKFEADIDRVKQELATHGIEVESLGGNIQAIPVSGKTGKGMDDLEEAISALSEAEDYRAEIDGQAEGWIIEANKTNAGKKATVLVRRGTLRPGDYIVAGTTWARIRSLRNDADQLIEEAPPGTPVVIDGWRDQPQAGYEVLQAKDEEQAKDVIEMRVEREEISRMVNDATAINTARKEEAEERARVLAWEAEQEWARLRPERRPKDNSGWVEPKEDDGMKRLNIVVKADVTGSVEAVVNALTGLGNNEVQANVIRSGVGPVTLSDIQHVSATGTKGYIVSFNQSIDGEMYRLAETAGVELLDHNIIYRMTDVVKEKLAELLPPIIKQKVHGEAEIGQVFEITVKKNVIKIAGSKVTNGTISRDRRIRVSRNNQVIYDGMF